MPSVLTIGNFDGVHLGHRHILARCRELADARGAEVVVLTFDPPPVAVLRPDATPPALCDIEDRVAELRRAGADQVEVVRPTPELLGQTPEQFVAGLVERYAPVALVEGRDFRFGKDRAGTVQTLTDLGQRHSFEVAVVDEVAVKLTHGVTAPVRSTLVRTLIGQARLLDAARCLDRPFSLRGTVVKGDQRGRTIDIPTANLDPATWAGTILPPDGVYAGLAEVAVDADTPSATTPLRSNATKRLAAAISVGVKPTFAGRQLTVEAHLLDLATNDPDALYGSTLRLSFARWVRDQYPFPSVQALADQLHRDIDRVRRWRDSGLLSPERTAA